MAIHAINWAMKQSINSTYKIVLIALSNYTDPNNVSWAGLNTIATIAVVSRSTAKRVIKELVKLGLVEKNPRYRKDGAQSSNEYKLNTDVYINGGPVVQVEPGGVQIEPGGGSTGEPGGGSKGGDNDLPLNNINHYNKNNGHFKKMTGVFNVSESFEKAWREYLPKYKMNKAEAIRTYTKAIINEVDEKRFFKGLENYKKWLEIETWQKPMYGSRFFTRHVWENWADYKFVENMDNVDNETISKWVDIALDKFIELRLMYRNLIPPEAWQIENKEKTYTDAFILRAMQEKLGYRRDILELVIEKFADAGRSGRENLTGKFLIEGEK